MSSTYGVDRPMTTVDEPTNPNKVQCPNCFTNVVPRGIISTLPGNSGGHSHCTNCGHTFGWDSLLDGRVTGVTLTAFEDATEIDTDGGTLQLFATVTPEHARDKRVEWDVTEVDGSPTTKATVSEDGVVTAAEDGTVRVMAKAVSPHRVIGHFDVTITNQA